MSRSMYKLLVVVLAISVLGAIAPAGAQAAPPTRQTIALTNTIEGFVPECGLNLRWGIDLTVERTFFFDGDGNLVRIQDQVRENNTITNIDTGETLEEGPDSFSQRILFNDDGTVTVQVNGLSVLVNDGEASVVDAGRLVLQFGPGGSSVLQLAGRHDIRSIDPLSTDDPALLAGFCDAFTG